MKKLSALVLLIMLFASSIASAAHACCADKSADGSHISQSVDNHDSHDGDAEAACDCTGCGCSHHGHSKTSLDYNSLDNLNITSSVTHNWAGDIYHSQLQAPTFKPPKA